MRGRQCFAWPEDFDRLIVSRAKGAIIEDVDGNRFLDFVESVSSVGHCNPEVVRAVKRQADRYIQGLGYTEMFVELAEMLKSILPMKKTGLAIAHAVSGTQACDEAIMIARRHTGRSIILAFQDAFHGYSGATAEITASARGEIPLPISDTAFVPYPYCYRCPFDRQYPECDLYCLKSFETIFESVAVPNSIAALFFEPIQAHGGVIVPPDGYFERLEKICRKHGILLVDDEVYTGFGKTGRFFAIEHWNVKPDMICMGKAMGAGLPIGALACNGGYMGGVLGGQGKFGTLAGNPLAASAAIAGIRFIQNHKILARTRKIGDYLMKAMSDLKQKFDLIGDVRGRGVLIGLELVKDKKKTPAITQTRKFAKYARNRGLLVGISGRYRNVISLDPPLVISMEQATKAIEILNEVSNEID